MKRLFEMTLPNSEETYNKVSEVFSSICKIHDRYEQIVYPNHICGTTGFPGISSNPDYDYEIQLLNCISALALKAIELRKTIKSNKHPLDKMKHEEVFDGVDSVYAMGWVERPKL